MTTGTLPELNKPPINEVVYGLRFPHSPILKSAHYGLFWSKVRDRYPRTEDTDPLIDFPPVGGQADEFSPLAHRVWLLDETDTRLLQLQRGRFYMNWRQVRPEDAYPRFSTLYPDFKKTATEFAEFVKELGVGVLQPQQLELTYINHIYDGGGWQLPQDAGAILRPLSWKREAKLSLAESTDVAWRMSFAGLDDAANLTASVRTGRRKADNAVLLVFELRAHTTHDGTLDEALEWYPMAREAIVRTFFDLTTQEARDTLWT